MTKAEIVAQIARNTGLDRESTLVVVEEFMDCVRESLTNGENVYLRGFGSFITKRRAQKIARNITAQTSVVVPAHDIPAFKPAKSFMQRVAGVDVTAED